MITLSNRNIFEKCSFLVLGLLAIFPHALLSNPTGGSVEAGSAVIKSSGNELLITQHSEKAVLHWEAFSIAKRETTRFHQPNKDSAALNIVRGFNPSIIDGMLKANGKILLVNPQGVIISKEGSVSTKGFLATTLYINSQDFLAGNNLLLKGDSEAEVINCGTILSELGDIFLVAKKVNNEGSIEAKNSVELLGGQEIHLFQNGSKPSVKIGGAGNVCNEGFIKAAEVRLQASGGNIYSSAVSNTGVIEARGFEKQGGHILLKGERNKTVNSGKLLAKNDDLTGGTIHILGEEIILTETSLIDVSSELGAGTVLVGGDLRGNSLEIPNSKSLIVEDGAKTFAQACQNGNGGKVIFWANEKNSFSGTVNARGLGKGNKGGFVEISSKGFWKYNGHVDVRCEGGQTGDLFFDPTNISISNKPTENFSWGFQGANKDANINTKELINALAFANVTIETSVGKDGAGDILFVDPIFSQNEYNLNVIASNNCTIDASIALEGGLSISAGNSVFVNDSINTGKNAASGIAISAKDEISVNNALIFSEYNLFKNIDGMILHAGGGDKPKITLSHSTLLSVNGNIILKTDQGLVFERGIDIQSGSLIETTGKGKHAGSIRINGTYGNSPRVCTGEFGVFLDETSSIKALDGDIQIKGLNKNKQINASGQCGVGVFGKIISTGIYSPTQKIEVTGKGSSLNGSRGVLLLGSEANILSNGSHISINGELDSEDIASLSGVGILGGAIVNADNNGSITISGLITGSGSGINHYGLHVEKSSLTTKDGNLSLIGKTYSNNSNTNAGIYLQDSNISSSGVWAKVGNISLLGEGSGGFNSYGILLSTKLKEKSSISTVDADIVLTGNISAYGLGMNFKGLEVDGYQITTTGTNDHSGSIKITGKIAQDGKTFSDQNEEVGIHLHNDARLETVDGAISFEGLSLAVGKSCYGVLVEEATIQTTGSKKASISILGDTTSHVTARGSREKGVWFTKGSSVIKSFDGDINIEGISEGDLAIGVYCDENTQIESSGLGSINLIGTIVSDENEKEFHDHCFGVFSHGEQTIKTNLGEISLTGVCKVVGQDNHGVVLNGTSLAAVGNGNIFLKGTSFGDNNSCGIHLLKMEKDSSITATDGDISLIGTVDVEKRAGIQCVGLKVDEGYEILSLANEKSIGNTLLKGSVLSSSKNMEISESNVGVQMLPTSQIINKEGIISVFGLVTTPGTKHYGLEVINSLLLSSSNMGNIDNIVLRGDISFSKAIDGGKENTGISVSGKQALISSMDGTININGDCINCGSYSTGVVFTGSPTCESVGKGGLSIRGAINANSSNPQSFCKGIFIQGDSKSTSPLSDKSGLIWMNGTCMALGENNIGIDISEATIQTSEMNEWPRDIFLDGSASGNKNILGVLLRGKTGCLQTVNGSINIMGTANAVGESSYLKGIDITDGFSINSTGHGDITVGSISLVGNVKEESDFSAPSYVVGVDLHSTASVKTIDGDLYITASIPIESDQSFGFSYDDQAKIQATDHARISISATGSTKGINLLEPLKAHRGDISLTGIANEMGTGIHITNIVGGSNMSGNIILHTDTLKLSDDENGLLASLRTKKDIHLIPTDLNASIGLGSETQAKLHLLDDELAAIHSGVKKVFIGNPKSGNHLIYVDNDKKNYTSKQELVFYGQNISIPTSMVLQAPSATLYIGQEEGVSFQLLGEVKAKNFAIHGGSFDDTFIIKNSLQKVTLLDAGGGESNSLVASDNDKAWAITQAYCGSVEQIKFQKIHHLIGGSGDDTFSLTNSKSFVDSVDGKDAGLNTLIGSSSHNKWMITEDNQGVLSTEKTKVNFFSINQLQGSKIQDHYYFEGPYQISDGIIAGPGVNSITGSNTKNEWLTTGDDAGIFWPEGAVSSTSFTQVQKWIGGLEEDHFTIGGAHRVTAGIDANLGNSNSITGPNVDTIWSLLGDNTGAIKPTKASGETRFSHVQSLLGNTANDSFSFKGPYYFEKGIFGGVQGENTLIGPNTNTQWTITGDNKIEISPENATASTTVEQIQTLIASKQNDEFVFSGPYQITGKIDGSNKGNNQVVGPDCSNRWISKGDNAGEIISLDFETVTSFENIATWIGGAGDDYFKISDAHTISGRIDGSTSGKNIIVGPDVSTNWTIDEDNFGTIKPKGAKASSAIINVQEWNSGGSENTYSFTGSYRIENGIVGRVNGNDRVLGPDSDTEWHISNNGKGELHFFEKTEPMIVTNIQEWVGGKGIDTFVMKDSSVIGEINGGGNENLFIASDIAAKWVVGGNNAGRFNSIEDKSVVSFENIHNIQTGTKSDEFVFAGNYQISGSIGICANNTQTSITGPDCNCEWTVTDTDVGEIFPKGALGKTKFSSFVKWIGGEANDTFKFAGPHMISEGINGGKDGLNTVVGDNTSHLWMVTEDNGGIFTPIDGHGETVLTNVQKFVGGNGVDHFSIFDSSYLEGGIVGNGNINSIQGPDITSHWSITGDNQGWIKPEGAIKQTFIKDIAKWIGGKAVDEFTFTGHYQISNGIQGGSGLNNIVNGPDVKTTWNIPDDNGVNILPKGAKGSTNCINIHNLIGKKGDDIFVFEGPYQLKGEIGLDGGESGTNSLFGPAISTTFSIDPTIKNTGAICPQGAKGKTPYKNISNITGSSKLDVLDYQEYTTAVVVDLGKGKATGITGSANSFERVIAGRDKNTFTGKKDKDNSFVFASSQFGKTIIHANRPSQKGNTIIMEAPVDNEFIIDGLNAGHINSKQIVFDEIGNLIGGSGNDTFFIEPNGNLTGARSIDGGKLGYNAICSLPQEKTTFTPNSEVAKAGSFSFETKGALIKIAYQHIDKLKGRSLHDVLDYSTFHTPVIVDLNKGVATHLNMVQEGSVTGITKIIAGLCQNSLSGQDGIDNDFVFQSLPTESSHIQGNTSAEKGNHLYLPIVSSSKVIIEGKDAGFVNGDKIIFANIGNIYGGDLPDLFGFRKTGCLSGVNGIQGGAGENNIHGSNTNTHWMITKDNQGVMLAHSADCETNFSNIHNIVGGNEEALFEINGPYKMTGLFGLSGGDGHNTIKGPDLYNTWTIEGNNAGTLSSKTEEGVVLSTKISKIDKWVAGNDVDKFIFEGPYLVERGLEGCSSSSNTIYAAKDVGNDWTVTGDNTGLVYPAEAIGATPIVNIEKWVGGDKKDRFDFFASGYVENGIYGSLEKGSVNTVVGPNDKNSWTITANDEGELSPALARKATEIFNIQHWIGNDVEDEFVFEKADWITGSILGSSKSNSRIIAPNVDNAWEIDGENSGTVFSQGAGGKTQFDNINELIGGEKTDEFTLIGKSFIDGIINGGISDSKIIATGVSHEWLISQNNGGSVLAFEAKEPTKFINISSLTGGSEDDIFTFEGSCQITKGIDGSEDGTNKVVGPNDNNIWTVSSDNGGKILPSQANGPTSLQNIHSWIGNVADDEYVFDGSYHVREGIDAGIEGNNKIVGPNKNSSWTITADNSGLLIAEENRLPVMFNNIHTIIGGDKEDQFIFAGPFQISGEGIDGGKGESFLIGSNESNDWNITANNAGSYKPTLRDASTQFINIHNIRGGDGADDLFTFDGPYQIDGEYGVFGGRGNNVLVGPDVDNLWTITKDDGGSLLSKDAQMKTNFSGIQNWIGGVADDEFTFTGDFKVSQAISGGNGGTSSIIGPNVDTEWMITKDFGGSFIAKDSKNETHFNNINLLQGSDHDDRFVFAGSYQLNGKTVGVDGGKGENTLSVIAETNNQWSVTNHNGGRLVLDDNTPIDFMNIQNLIGGKAKDHFVFDGEYQLSGSIGIDGGDGGNNSLKGPNMDTQWLVQGDNRGSLLSKNMDKAVKIANIENWIGGNSRDTFVFDLSYYIDNGIDGGVGGINSIVGSNTYNKWTILGDNEGTVDLRGSSKKTSFTNVHQLTGGKKNDQFTILGSYKIEGGIIGGKGGLNSVLVPNTTNSWALLGDNEGTVHMQEAEDAISMSNIHRWVGGAGDDLFSILGPYELSVGIDGGAGDQNILNAPKNVSNRWIVMGDNAGFLHPKGVKEPIGFERVNVWNGGEVEDDFVFTGNYRVSGGIFGGVVGNHSVTGPNVDTNWTITGENQGHYISEDNENIKVDLTRIQKWIGGEKNDLFTFSGSFRLDKGICGGSGGMNSVYAPEDDCQWTITEDNGGHLRLANAFGVTKLNNIHSWIGSNGVNTFTFKGIYQVKEGLVGGKGTENKIFASDTNNDWTITGDNSGVISPNRATGKTPFENIQFLKGGHADDRFIFDGPYEVSGGIEGAEGENTIVGSDDSCEWHVINHDKGNLTYHESNVMTSFININNLIGGKEKNLFYIEGPYELSGSIGISANENSTENNEIYAPNTKNHWSILDHNEGELVIEGSEKPLKFSSVHKCIGGSSDDEFVFAGDYQLSKGLDGGAGGSNLLLASEESSHSWCITHDCAGTFKADQCDEKISFENIHFIKGGRYEDQFAFEGNYQIPLGIDGFLGQNTILGTDAGANWYISSNNCGRMISEGYEQKFNHIHNIIAGTGIDHFVIEGPYQLDGDIGIDGSSGRNTVTCSNDKGSLWTILADNGGHVMPKGANETTKLSNIQMWMGGNGVDDFVFKGPYQLQEGIFAESGSFNTVTGPHAGSYWTIKDTNSGKVDPEGSNGPTNIAGCSYWKGGEGDDHFIFSSSCSIEKGIDGGIGGMNSVKGPYDNNTWRVIAENEGILISEKVKENPTGLKNIQMLKGNDLQDDFYFRGAFCLTGGLIGGMGQNTLYGPDVDNEWRVTSVNTGVLCSNNGAIRIPISGVERWVGGLKNDHFVFTGPYLVSGGIDGTENGVNSITGPDCDARWEITANDGGAFSSGQYATAKTHFSNIQAWFGGSGHDTYTYKGAYQISNGIDGGAGGTNAIYGPNVDIVWRIKEDNGGTILPKTARGETKLMNMHHWLGSACDDEYYFMGAYYLSKGIVGNGGNNLIQSPNVNNVWELHSNNTGYISPEGAMEKTHISNIQNWSGGSLCDDFYILGPFGISGIVDGGSGADNSLSPPSGTNHWIKNGDDAGKIKHIRSGSTTNFKNIQNWIMGPEDTGDTND